MEGADESAGWPFRALKLGIIGTLAASVVLAGLLVPWNELFSSGPPRPHVSPDGALNWEAEGWIRSAAPTSSTIRVSSGFLGLSSLTLVVPFDALIMVAGKEGGFDDLHEGRRVRAIYEARPNGLRAKTIEVLVAGTPSAGLPRESAAPVPSGIRPSSTAPTDPRPATDSARPSSKSPEMQSRASTPAPKPADPRSTLGVTAPARKPADPPPATRVLPARSVEARSTAEVPPAAPKPVDLPPNPLPPEGAPRGVPAEARLGPASDPGAVIDWLLKESLASSP